MKLLRALLLPFSILYGIAVFFRNLLYDVGLLRSESFDISIISVGNLSLGGTGKSPHIEYLISLLKNGNQIATLSRGYGRTTQGFVCAGQESDFLEIGDEPMQFFHKFKGLEVAVDENRRRGIKNLQEKNPLLNVILLDDAFQHRAVKPGLSILLTDYSKLYADDFLLPVGNLREWRAAAGRADIIIVTRIPQLFSPMERRIISERLHLKPYQKIYFSFIKYGEFKAFHNSQEQVMPGKEYYFERKFSIVLFTGIANPQPLLDYLKGKGAEVMHLKYRDHHRYTISDIQRIKQIFDNIATDNKILLTTEKDAMRLLLPGYRDIIQKLPLFYIPIETGLIGKDESEFNELIISYVRKNQVHRRIYKKQN